MSELIERYTEQLGRSVFLRPGTSDEQGWHDVFDPDRAFHVPPDDMPTPRTVLDLGANIGLTAAHYAAMWPDAIVWMVEPNPENMELAKKNAPGCPVVTCAVASSSSEHWFLVEEGLSADAYYLGTEEDGRGREVYGIGLDELARIAAPDFVKMDIEGGEWDVVDAGVWWTPFVPYLLVEFHDEPRDGPAIVARGIDVLESIGYDARHHEVHPQSVWAVRR